MPNKVCLEKVSLDASCKAGGKGCIDREVGELVFGAMDLKVKVRVSRDVGV